MFGHPISAIRAALKNTVVACARHLATAIQCDHFTNIENVRPILDDLVASGELLNRVVPNLPRHLADKQPVIGVRPPGLCFLNTEFETALRNAPRQIALCPRKIYFLPDAQTKVEGLIEEHSWSASPSATLQKGDLTKLEALLHVASFRLARHPSSWTFPYVGPCFEEPAEGAPHLVSKEGGAPSERSISEILTVTAPWSWPPDAESRVVTSILIEVLAPSLIQRLRTVWEITKRARRADRCQLLADVLIAQHPLVQQFPLNHWMFLFPQVDSSKQSSKTAMTGSSTNSEF